MTNFPRDSDNLLKYVQGLEKRLYSLERRKFSSMLFPAGSPALNGAAPPEGTQMLIKASTVVVAVSGGSGSTAFNYVGGPFPNGVVSVVVTPGDNTASFSAMRMVPVSSSLTTYAGLALTQTGFVPVGQIIRINYVAVGW